MKNVYKQSQALKKIMAYQGGIRIQTVVKRGKREGKE